VGIECEAAGIECKGVGIECEAAGIECKGVGIEWDRAPVRWDGLSASQTTDTIRRSAARAPAGPA
jgi:hypothetical protein